MSCPRPLSEGVEMSSGEVGEMVVTRMASIMALSANAEPVSR